MGARAPPEGPPLDDLASVFHVEETRRDGDRLLYVGEPLADAETVERSVWPLFRERGYEVRLADTAQQVPDPITGVGIPTRRHVLVAEPVSLGIDGIPWTNVLFAALTVLSTLFAGASWYYIDLGGDPLALLGAWPFAAAVLGVLGIHELGHYVMSRYHRVAASLPYFIPFPTLIGTMGAVIRMRGRIPDRKALFDIGVAGPLAGLVAAVVVSVIGLYLPPVAVPESLLNSPDAIQVEFGYPLLLRGLAWLTGQPLEYAQPGLSVNPVVFGGWVGMFVTFLNLLPVGQLDGGHLVRAMLGERQETVGVAVPAALFGLGGYLYAFGGYENPLNAAGIWLFWGLFAMGLAYAGPADPLEEAPLDRTRMTIGLLTFVFGLLCFVPVPFRIIG
jgi:membrane-associated protease RseP (regulator of RpoE activity)